MMSENAQVTMTEQAPLPAIPFSREKVELIKRTVAQGVTDDELQLFLHVAGRSGLDPFAKQIHAVKRYNKGQGREVMSIQTGIDGYRLLADRSGKYAGSDDYTFDDGLTEYQHIQSKRDKPTTATVTVWKLAGGQRVPFTATARWQEYYPGDKQGFMWNKMPYLMLGKCAEALALRKAFPAELSGMYIREEMEQAGEIVDAHVSAGAEPTSDNQKNGDNSTPPDRAAMLKRITALREKAQNLTEGKRWNDFHTKSHLEKYYEMESVVALNNEQLLNLGKKIRAEVNELEAQIDAQPDDAQNA